MAGVSRTFKYRVCQVQSARVTFVNGHWQGLQVPVESGPAGLLNSCPMVWEYLESAGRDGWELVAASRQSGNYGMASPGSSTLIFLKKETTDAGPEPEVGHSRSTAGGPDPA